MPGESDSEPVRHEQIFPVRLVVQAPHEWLVEGYRDAYTRFQAVTPSPDSREGFKALFEALSWMSTVEASTKRRRRIDTSAPMLRGLRFARERAHHQWGSAVSAPDGEWCWRPASQLPDPDSHHQRGADKEAERQAYAENLAGRPVREALEWFERFLTSHGG